MGGTGPNEPAGGQAGGRAGIRSSGFSSWSSSPCSALTKPHVKQVQTSDQPLQRPGGAEEELQTEEGCVVAFLFLGRIRGYH